MNLFNKNKNIVIKWVFDLYHLSWNWTSEFVLFFESQRKSSHKSSFLTYLCPEIGISGKDKPKTFKNNSVSSFSLWIYRNTIEFCVLTLYSMTYVKSVISSKKLWLVAIFSHHMTSQSVSLNISCFKLPFLAKTSSMMLNKRWEYTAMPCSQS